MTSLLSGVTGYLISAAVAALLAASGTYYVVHKMDQAALEKLQIADGLEAIKAEKDFAAAQKSEDDVSLAAAVAEAEAQQRIVTHTVTVTREVVKHVPVGTPCIPFGLVRVLNDAATGSDTADAPTPAGQSDDACSGVSWRSLADDLTSDYGAGRQNAEQLNALESSIKNIVKAANQ